MIVENNDKDINIEDYGIRRLTPRECWRLMDFSDEDFDKAKYEKGTLDLIGGIEKYSAKLMAVQEKPKHINLGAYVSCTIKDSKDMEILKTIMKNYICAESGENIQNVNIAIEKLDGLGQWGCVINTTKCIDFMGDALYFDARERPTNKGYYRIGKTGQHEHRKVYEDYYKIKLGSEQVIHHINFNKTDNRIENLWLYNSRTEHNRVHSAYRNLRKQYPSEDIEFVDGIYKPKNVRLSTL